MRSAIAFAIGLALASTPVGGSAYKPAPNRQLSQLIAVECRFVAYEDGSTTFRDAEAAYRCLKRNHAPLVFRWK